MGPKGVLPQKRLLLSATRPQKAPRPKIVNHPISLNNLVVIDPEIKQIKDSKPNVYMKISNMDLIIEKDNKTVKLNLTENQKLLLAILFSNPFP